MYLITIYDGPGDYQGTVINSPFADDLKCKYTIHQVLQGVSDMEITLNPANPGWGQIKPLRTLITAVDIQSGEEVFSGRVLKPTQTMEQDGLFQVKFICESKLAYLNDSTQRYGVYQNISIRAFMETIISTHNAQVEAHKRFKVGEVTVTDPYNEPIRYLDYEKTFDTLQNMLIDRLGGVLRIREELDGTYLDYLKNVGEVQNTPIRLRTNLKSLQREIDPTEVITRLVVLGAKVSEDADDHQRLTMASVNGGKDYLDNLALIREFGIIEGVLVLDDIDTPSTLLVRANQFFAGQAASRNSYTVSALDLSRVDNLYSRFRVGDWYQLEAGPLDISEPLQLIGKTMTDDNPQLDQLEIGQKHKTLTQYQHETAKRMRTLEDVRSRVDMQSITIQSVNEQLQTVDNQVNNLTNALQLDDESGVLEALSELQASIDALGATSIALGDIGQLQTTAKGSVVEAINELVARIEALEGTP